MALDMNDEADKAAVQKMIDDAVAGLKTKNGEVIGDNKKLKDALKELQTTVEGLGDLTALKGIDVNAIRTLLDKAASEEERTLIAAGRIDQVITNRTEALRTNLQKEVTKRDERVKALEESNNRFRSHVLSDHLRSAATKAGAEPTAMEDISLRGGLVFRVDEEGNVVAMKPDGTPILGKDGVTPLAPSEWLEGLRESAPHLWPKAAGGGAPGSGGKAGSKKLSEMSEQERSDLYKKSPAEYEAAKKADPAFANPRPS